MTRWEISFVRREHIEIKTNQDVVDHGTIRQFGTLARDWRTSRVLSPVDVERPLGLGRAYRAGRKKRKVISLRRVIYPGHLPVALLTELHQSLFATAFIPIFHGDITYSDCAVDTLAGTSGNPSESHSTSDTKLESFPVYSDCSRSNPINVSTGSRKQKRKASIA